MSLSQSQQIVSLQIRGDPDGTGTRTATFEMVSAPDSGLEVSHELRTGFVVDDRGQIVNSVLNEVAGNGESSNKGFYVDLGTSQYALECQFVGYEGGTYQWGDTGTGGTATDATGDGPIEQAQVFLNWVRSTNIDSLPDGNGNTAATLEFGLHHPDDVLEPLDVVLENPTLTPSGPGQLDGSITMIEAANLGDTLDAQNNSKLGSGP